METPYDNRLALALDNVSSLSAVKDLIHATAPSIGVFKIGLELFSRFGPPVCDVVREARRKIFLDLKLHDIPNTVEKAVTAACDLKIDFLTVHTQGGTSMLSAAVNARRQKTKIIGVTLLTSIDADCLENDLLVNTPPAEYVKHLASLAVRAGLDGIVCSAVDLPIVKPGLSAGLPPGFEIITPGIRPAGCATNDQKRIATPKEAIKNGATLLVVGRSVTEAPDPAKAAAAMVTEIEGK
jgi:orotidine-5'-phosphate decarboxylase